MSLKEPEVLTGARGGPEERKQLGAAQAAKRGTGPDEIPANEVWFQARFTRYRVQLTAPQDQKLPDGRVLRENPIVGQFDKAMLRLRKDIKKDAKAIELLRKHRSYGRDFWDFADVLEQMRQKEVDDAVSVLKDPSKKALILAQLKAEGVDFVLPEKQASKSGRSKKGEAEATSSDSD
jgi:hypothetical protein